MKGRFPGRAQRVDGKSPLPLRLETARERGLEALCLPSKDVPRDQYDGQLADELDRRGIDLICLAGFMRLLSAEFVRRFPLRILNIHPSLLPAFPGLDAQAQALAHGAKVTGCTVHFVDANLDAGPILLQAAVPVLHDDTVESLSARILVQEHRIYSEAVALVVSGNWRVEGRRVTQTEPRPQGAVLG